MTLTLTGYYYSVYTRAARMALLARGLEHDYTEVDPFDPVLAAPLQALHPFGRVPVLEDGDFRLWETQAILDYVAVQGSGAKLVPDGPPARARMRQVMNIADSYVYWPLVRQVVSHAIFLPPQDDNTERALTIIAAGMARAREVMAALDDIADEGLVLISGQLTLADCLLWPMLDYLLLVPEGREALAAHAALADWAEAMAVHPVAVKTRPDLAQLHGALR